MSANASTESLDPPSAQAAAHDRPWIIRDGLLPGDAYLEGPYEVFTEQYHLRRGFCCNSGCRHCPYRGGGDSA